MQPSAPSAQAAVIKNTTAIPVPQNAFGVYLDLATGATAAASFTGYDINLYGTTTLTFYVGTSGTTLVAPTTTSAPSALPLGTVISLSSTFSTVTTSTNFRTTGNEYLGLSFTNTTTGVINYGYLELSTRGTTGAPATITGYSYENTGAAITVVALNPAAVPEPGTVAALGFGALSLGAAGVRRWRKAKQA